MDSLQPTLVRISVNQAPAKRREAVGRVDVKISPFPPSAANKALCDRPFLIRLGKHHHPRIDKELYVMDMHELTRELKMHNDSKIVMLVADGLGGLPLAPGGKTELATARTPN